MDNVCLCVPAVCVSVGSCCTWSMHGPCPHAGPGKAELGNKHPRSSGKVLLGPENGKSVNETSGCKAEPPHAKVSFPERGFCSSRSFRSVGWNLFTQWFFLVKFSSFSCCVELDPGLKLLLVPSPASFPPRLSSSSSWALT